jgi:DNA-directed RNA polymerase subunit RPC12/RpoP
MSTIMNLKLKTLVYIIAFIAVVIIGAVITLSRFSTAGFAIYGIVVLTSLLVLVGWHAQTFAYQCANCGGEFEITFWRDLISPHGPRKDGGWKLLRCPHCEKWSRAKIIPKERRL